MGTPKSGGFWPTVAMVAVLAITFSSFVIGGPETDQGGDSWPHGVNVTPSGPTAYQRLTEIHNLAISVLPTASPEDRPEIERVLRLSFECVAYDGAAPNAEPPLPEKAHQAPHTGAAAKVEAAWQALHRPPQLPEHPGIWQDWAACADNLEHGHDE